MSDWIVEQEEDNIPAAVTVIIIVTVLLVVSAVLMAVWLMETRDTTYKGLSPSENIAHPFDSASLPAQARRERKMQQLNTYAWVDRERKVVRIPVTEAMPLWLQQQEDAQP